MTDYDRGYLDALYDAALKVDALSKLSPNRLACEWIATEIRQMTAEKHQRIEKQKGPHGG